MSKIFPELRSAANAAVSQLNPKKNYVKFFS